MIMKRIDAQVRIYENWSQFYSISLSDSDNIRYSPTHFFSRTSRHLRVSHLPSLSL